MVFTNDEPGQSSSAIDKAPKEIKETASIKPFSRPGKLEGELQDLENVTSEENPGNLLHTKYGLKLSICFPDLHA